MPKLKTPMTNHNPTDSYVCVIIMLDYSSKIIRVLHLSGVSPETGLGSIINLRPIIADASMRCYASIILKNNGFQSQIRLAKEYLSQVVETMLIQGTDRLGGSICMVISI